MAFICILCGGLQVVMLLSLTGILVSLAAVSRLMELTFTVVQPAVLFLLRQSVRLIVFGIALSLQRMSNVLRRICSAPTQEFDAPVGCFGDSEDSVALNIGVIPVQVPYFRYTYQAEKLATLSDERLSPVVVKLDDPAENVEEEPTQQEL